MPGHCYSLPSAVGLGLCWDKHPSHLNLLLLEARPGAGLGSRRKIRRVDRRRLSRGWHTPISVCLHRRHLHPHTQNCCSWKVMSTHLYFIPCGQAGSKWETSTCSTSSSTPFSSNFVHTYMLVHLEATMSSIFFLEKFIYFYVQ